MNQMWLKVQLVFFFNVSSPIFSFVDSIMERCCKQPAICLSFISEDRMTL